jgi:hypothetical protein
MDDDRNPPASGMFLDELGLFLNWQDADLLRAECLETRAPRRDAGALDGLLIYRSVGRSNT